MIRGLDAQWSEGLSPWKLVERDGRWYGRGVVDNKGRDLVLPSQVEVYRDLTYADSDVLAKTQEEELLWRDMETDLVQQLMRRLAATKPTPPAAAE